jgi:cytoskeletal protein CcmA (bactofilin family)
VRHAIQLNGSRPVVKENGDMEQNQNAQSVISGEVEITGTVKSSGSIRLDGKLNGDLECSGDATIGKGASVKGNLSVNGVSIAGEINGNVTAKDRIEMKTSARVMGDIKAKRLAVEDGVTFIGKSEVNPSGAASGSPAPSAAPAAAEGGKTDAGKPAVLGKR